jgi:hypothetical protein
MSYGVHIGGPKPKKPPKPSDFNWSIANFKTQGVYTRLCVRSMKKSSAPFSHGLLLLTNSRKHPSKLRIAMFKLVSHLESKNKATLRGRFGPQVFESKVF